MKLKKFTFTLGSLLVLLLGLASMGCGPATTLAASEQPLTATPTTPVFLPLVSSESAGHNAQLSAAVSQADSPLPTPGQMEWATYTHDRYPFSIEYPADWQAYVSFRGEDDDHTATWEWVVFGPAGCETDRQKCELTVDVMERTVHPVTSQEVAELLDPAFLPPEEVGARAYNIKHFSTGTVEGMQYVAGPLPDNGMLQFAQFSLQVVLPSAEQSLIVRVRKDLDVDISKPVTEANLEEAVDAQAAIFEHMARSVQVGEATEQ